VRVATPLVGRPCLLTVPVEADHLILSARVYGVCNAGGCILRLTGDGERRASLACDKSDSALLAASVSNAVWPMHVACEPERMEAGVVPYFSIAHFGVLRVASRSYAAEWVRQQLPWCLTMTCFKRRSVSARVLFR
jgi:hypothetical protein